MHQCPECATWSMAWDARCRSFLCLNLKCNHAVRSLDETTATMIYVVQVLVPWSSATAWRCVGAFSNPDEAKAFASAHPRPRDAVRVIEIPAGGELSRTLNEGRV